MQSHEPHNPAHNGPAEYWIKVVFVGFLFIGSFVTIIPMVMTSKKSSEVTTATNNAKQIFLLMVEFDDDFQKFPNDETAAADQDLVDFKGEYSNDYLGQFLAGGYVQSEEIFYAEGGSKGQSKADNVYDTKDNTLGEGECGFAYVKNLSTKFDSGTPILLAPMYGDGYKFNSDVYGGKAVVLRIDGSVQTLRLNKDRHALLPGGKTLFQDGKDTVWAEEGFPAKNLLYAKYPYKFTPALIKKEWLTPLNFLALLWLLIFIIYICKKILGSRKKRSLASETSGDSMTS